MKKNPSPYEGVKSFSKLKKNQVQIPYPQNYHRDDDYDTHTKVRPYCKQDEFMTLNDLRQHVSEDDSECEFKIDCEREEDEISDTFSDSLDKNMERENFVRIHTEERKNKKKDVILDLKKEKITDIW